MRALIIVLVCIISLEGFIWTLADSPSLTWEEIEQEEFDRHGRYGS